MSAVAQKDVMTGELRAVTVSAAPASPVNVRAFLGSGVDLC